MRRAAWTVMLGPLLVACFSIDDTAEKGGAGPVDGSVEGGVFPEAEAGGAAGAGGSGGAPDGGLCEPGVDCTGCQGCVAACVCDGGDLMPCKSQCGQGGGSGGVPP